MDAGLGGAAVLVTGAAGGIGQAIARAFAAEGASLALHYHRNEDAARRLAAELGARAVTVPADLRDEPQVDALYQQTLRAFPRLDALVVNAGIWVERPAALHEMTLAQWRDTLETDLTSAFLTCRGFLRHLATVRRESASIVLVASTAALFGEANHADYAAAKAGLAYGLTRSVKNEIVQLAPRGRVNCVCPGWVATPMTKRSIQDPALIARVTSTMALRKLATPADVAAAVVFFSSERLAGHLSGTVLPIAGGMEGRLLHP